MHLYSGYREECRLTFHIFYVNRLIDEGKLMDALAISDRFLQIGASDRLLQLLVERGEENILSGQSQGYSGNHNWSHSWQYCLRLKDKQLAARLALKYVYKSLFLLLSSLLCVQWK